MLYPLELRALGDRKKLTGPALLNSGLIVTGRSYVTFIYHIRKCGCESIHRVRDLLRQRLNICLPRCFDFFVLENFLDGDVWHALIVQHRCTPARKM